MAGGFKISITGMVQGVGFRPFVYNLALERGIKGYCLNDSSGVFIEAHGEQVDAFMEELRTKAPVLSRIESMLVQSTGAGHRFDKFEIRESLKQDNAFALVSPDASTCPDCIKELFDQSDRRHLYPFINCTNCGPRYSIIKDTPYDRAQTTMSAFKMCRACEQEYHDPADRRFHAQPNACSICGPRAWIAGKDGAAIDDAGVNSSAIERAQSLLKDGRILAIKGIGGFHLACDAQNLDAVKRLRLGKRAGYKKGAPNNKPFALMSPDTLAIRSFAELSQEEEKELLSPAHPIVLLKKLIPEKLSHDVAPGNADYGVMLPYAPLHHILLNSGAPIETLVMTSGNLSDEPIVTDNDEAIKRLSGIADFFLLHDRDIHMRVDDSIVRITDGRRTTIRRSRGYAPQPVNVGGEGREVFAAGAQFKNTFCITKGGYAVISQHIGDIENEETIAFYAESLANIRKTFKARPAIIAHDMHPDYMSTRFALEYAKKEGIPETRVIGVQHHHAHVVSCMAEHGLIEPVIGVAFDGTGYGIDGNIWGGEFFIADRHGFKRKAHLAYVAMPGGEAAIREPWRMALSYALHACGEEAVGQLLQKQLKRFDLGKATTIIRMISSGINSPLTSSAGRLFDAIASLLGVMDAATFEAEAAITLEAIADADADEPYFQPAYAFSSSEAPVAIDASELIKGIIFDLTNNVDAAIIAGRAHHTIKEVIAQVVKGMSEQYGINDVVLSGGVFQNALLTRITRKRLEAQGSTVWTHEAMPCNDGGICLGQAVVARQTIAAQERDG
ncbi:MAG: carbamoyltransferase HypF [Deltaproteobacteria bacterium]|nr:carbamoyltransferase HypF [Deltaproteobacteria bacterium]